MRRYFARLIDMLWPPGARMTGGHGNEAGFEVSAPMLRDWRNVADFLALAEGLVPSAGKLVQLRHATHQAEVDELRGRPERLTSGGEQACVRVAGNQVGVAGVFGGAVPVLASGRLPDDTFVEIGEE